MARATVSPDIRVPRAIYVLAPTIATTTVIALMVRAVASLATRAWTARSDRARTTAQAMVPAPSSNAPATKATLASIAP